jgi:hypothetical protein
MLQLKEEQGDILVRSKAYTSLQAHGRGQVHILCLALMAPTHGLIRYIKLNLIELFSNSSLSCTVEQ